MIDDLIRLANKLDDIGEHRHADFVDLIGLASKSTGSQIVKKSFRMKEDVELADNVLRFISRNPAVKAGRTIGKVTPIGIAMEVALAIYEINQNLEPRPDKYTWGEPGASHCPGGCHSPSGQSEYSSSFTNLDMEADVGGDDIDKKAFGDLINSISRTLVGHPADVQENWREKLNEMSSSDGLPENVIPFQPYLDNSRVPGVETGTHRDSEEDTDEDSEEWEVNVLTSLAVTPEGVNGAYAYYIFPGGAPFAKNVIEKVMEAESSMSHAIFEGILGLSLGWFLSTTPPGSFPAKADEGRICSLPNVIWYLSREVALSSGKTGSFFNKWFLMNLSATPNERIRIGDGMTAFLANDYYDTLDETPRSCMRVLR